MSTRGDRDGGASGTADQQASWLGDTDLREGYAELGDVRLHYVEAGHGPLVPGVLVRVATPDRTARSGGIPRRCSRHARLQSVIATKGGRDLRRQPVDQPHQWAWAMAMQHPEVVARLAILNAAHPRKLSQGLHHPGQLRKSWYFFFFDLPDPPESIVHANGWHFFRHFLSDARPAYTPEELDRYVEAWSQPGAATGMINYYRSSVRTSPKEAEAAIRPIEAPTLVIWGQRDHYLGPELAEPEHDDVPNLDRVERLPEASHWVHHDGAGRVTTLLIDFFAHQRSKEPTAVS